MKATLFSLLVLTVLNVNSAHASALTGTWSGTGTWVQKGSFVPIDKNEPCSKIEIKFTGDQESVNVETYSAECGTLSSDWGPLNFKIRNGKVYGDDEELGTFDGRTFISTIPDGSVEYAFNFEIQGDLEHPTGLRTYYGARNLVGTTVIEGQLMKR